MSIELGQFGIWQRTADTSPETAKEVEQLGFGALWAGGSPPADLEAIEVLLDATEAMPVATGIVNMWKADADTVAASYHRINDRHPNRLLLGVGIGHPEATSEYRKPYDTMVEYLDELDEAGVPGEHMIVAALGPRSLRLASERTAGTHPYFTTPRHTRYAREIVGPDVFIAPEQTVVVDSDPERARKTARSFSARYLGLVNYRNSLLREGWDPADLEGAGSDRLLDEVVFTGDVSQVTDGIRAHIEAGADHVCIQDLGPDPVGSYRALADALL